MELYTVDCIKETPTIKELESKREQHKINILLQRVVRERITNAVAVWKNTNHIPNTVHYYELAVVKDLIAMHGTDRSFDMSAEDLHGTDND